MNGVLLSEVFLKIINMSISASWLVLAVVLIRLVLKKAPKWISVLLWGFVAIRLICPFSIESVLSLIPSAETVNPDVMMDWTPEISTGIGSVDTVINPIITQTFAPQPSASANPLQILIPVAGMAWLAGIAVMLIYTAISYILLRRRVATAVLFRNNIYQSENVDSPFVLGIIKPKIYLPFQMDGKNLEHVIAHEESHIRRKDHWWKPFGFLLLALHWFNPLVWLGYILLCRDIELACDEKVIKEMDNENRADYTQALVACSVSRRRIAACPLAFGEVGVKERVKSVMNYKKPAFWIIVTAVIACIAVAVCFLTNPKEEDNPNLAEDGYYLLIGEEGVESIQVSGPNSGGGVVNADGSAFKKGEQVWLEHLQGVTDLRGYSITAYGKNGQIIYALSIPAGATDSEVVNLVSGDGWFLAPSDFELKLSQVSGKTYLYENEGILGSFTIRLYNDGTFTYSEGNASSYFGVGTWKQNGDIITMTDDGEGGYGLVNHFKLNGNDLVFAEQDSFNFIYVKVKNGEKFHCTGEVFKPSKYGTVSQIGGADIPANGIITNSNGVKIVVETIDKAISDAILEKNAGDAFLNEPTGLIPVEAHDMLGIVSVSGTPLAGQTNHMQEVIVYVQYAYHRYSHSNGKLDRVAGTGRPAMLTFTKNEDGGYTLKEFWEPNGGSWYAEDIRKMFPEDIADMVLNPESDIIDTEALEAKCLIKAQEYVSSLANP